MEFQNFEDKLEIVAAKVESPTNRNKERICFDKADGYHLIDSNGKRYVDLINGKGAVMLGHNDKDVNQAIIDSIVGLDNIHTGPSDVVLELSNMILEDIHLDDAKITYFSTGTAACRAAVLLAKKYTGKDIIISAGYHGWDLM